MPYARRALRVAILLAIALLPMNSSAQQTVTFSGSMERAAGVSDGALRPVVGVQEHGIVRLTRRAAELANAPGKHNLDALLAHHPMLTYWNGAFYLQFLATRYEDDANSKTPVYLASSRDGRSWSAPHLLFDPPNEPHMEAHLRMSFYLAANGRLLASTFIGPNPPNHGTGGFARVAREVKGPTAFGPTYAIRYNAGFDETNTPWPLFTKSDDAGFVAACQQLLDDKLVHQAWAEEDSGQQDAEFFAVPTRGDDSDFSGKAFNSYRLADDTLVGMWKDGWVGRTSGRAWENVRLDQNMKRFDEHRRAKMWGEPLSTGRYAMFYDLPTALPNAPAYGWDTRTPLVVVTSPDGLAYEGDPLVVSGDPGPQLFRNTSKIDNKTVGASYVRGISWLANREDQARPNDNVWLTYSVNKESIWVAEVPRAMARSVSEPVNDDFAHFAVGGRVDGWNIRDGAWTPVRLVKDEGGATVLRLADRDPYDYARAFRVFPAAAQVKIATRVRPLQNANGELHIELVGARGERPVRLAFQRDGQIAHQTVDQKWHKLGQYAAGAWQNLEFSCDLVARTWSVRANGTVMGENLPLAEPVSSVERAEFRTGAYRLTDFSTGGYGWGTPGYRDTDLPGADDPAPEASFDVASLRSVGWG